MGHFPIEGWHDHCFLIPSPFPLSMDNLTEETSKDSPQRSEIFLNKEEFDVPSFTPKKPLESIDGAKRRMREVA